MRLVCLLLLSGRALAATEPIPDGVADDQTAYTTDDKGAATALDVATGKNRWTSAEHGVVLAVDAQHVAVWQGAHVAFLDPATGKLETRSADVTFKLAGSASVRGRWQDGALVVDWLQAYFSPSHSGGIANGTRFVGQVLIDPANGSVKTPAAPTEPKGPQVDRAMQSGPIYVDGAVSATLLREVTADGREEMEMLRYDPAGNQLPSVKLRTGHQIIVAFLGDDAVVREGVEPATLAPDARFVDIYSITSGTLLGRLPLSVGGLSPIVVGGAILVLQQQAHSTARPDPGRARALEAYDARSSKLLWRHDLAPEDAPLLPP
jgi:hypothetical protein